MYTYIHTYTGMYISIHLYVGIYDISKHSPNNSPLAKIFNKNNFKVSYSCTNNMAQIIKKKKKKKKSHPPTVQHTPATNAIVGLKAHASYQINAFIETSYTKPR